MVPPLILAVDNFEGSHPERHIAILPLKPFDTLVHIPTALPDLLTKGVCTHHDHFDMGVEAIDDQFAGRGGTT